MTPQLFAKWLLRAVSVCLLLAAASGCGPNSPKPPEPMTAGITGYNYTREGVQEYYVNGERGSNLPAYGGGGSVSCCVSLPAQWSPDLRVTVDWTIGHWTTAYETRKHLTVQQQIECCFTERSLRRTASVERYGKEGGRLQVFFLPNDEIEVWVYNAGPQNPGHPSRRGYPENPEAKN
jgi:hypothetical protein